jgi:signal transduction histidine kinase
MTSQRSDSPSRRSSLVAWFARVNTEVSQWASAMSWWRLIVLFLLILIAANIIADLLHLKHDRVQIAGKDKDVVVNIGGRDGIRIFKHGRGDVLVLPARPPVPGASSAGSAPGMPDADASTVVSDGNDNEDVVIGRRIVTFRGILGDLGAVVLVVLFAYLAAAKIVVRKVAQADAKVRSAEDAAEHEAMQRQLVQARLQVLQAQVEPHFLFNTLSAVDYLIETEPPRASRMQKALITYLRSALPQMRQESSTLGRELRLIKSYLELIKMRIEERLDVDIAVPQGLESAEFPPMMLQSLVENAIKHGIEPKPEGGKVRVAAGVQDAQLWVEVGDTGVGVPDGNLLDGPTSGTGIGLQNLRERLAVLYPGKSRLMLRSDPATGTVVRITVPYRVSPEAAAAAAADESGYPENKPA